MINLSTFLYQESLAQSRDWSDEQILPLNLRECTGRSLFLKFSPVRVDVLNGKKDIADKKTYVLKARSFQEGWTRSIGSKDR